MASSCVIRFIRVARAQSSLCKFEWVLIGPAATTAATDPGGAVLRAVTDESGCFISLTTIFIVGGVIT